MRRNQTLIWGALMGSILCVPLFAFAQTSTTTAEQPVDPWYQLQQDLLKIRQDQIKSAPTIEELTSKSISENLEVTTSPKNPGPRDFVTVSIQSYVTDLNKASITWILNDKIISSGVGVKSFKFQNGVSGETTRLTVIINTNEGVAATKELSWTPVGVTLFWQANTYTPPFYKGKPLLSTQSKVKVVATPDNLDGKNTLGAGGFVYSWKQDGAGNETSSGYGKNSFSITGPQLYRKTEIGVQVSPVNNDIASETKIELSPTRPFILFYENNPLSGIAYSKPIGGSITFSGKEFSITAAPYFFSNENLDTDSFQYSWLVNGKNVQNQGRNITLRNETGGAGSSIIGLSVTGLQKTFQTASQSLQINFSEDTTTKPLF